MGELLIGTSGYDYPQDWRGVFYPDRMKHDEFLSFYATQFNALELNFSYYNVPRAENIQKMIDQTAHRVKFSIKANQALTHNVELGTWQVVVSEFIKGIEPLMKADLLVSVLLQFPQSFIYDKARRIYLADLIKAFGPVPLVAEFRHTSWLRESVYTGLDKMGVGLCVCDMPNLRNLPQFNPLVLGGKAYMRFHGRNGKTWYSGDSRSRYDYRYSDDELNAYKGPLEAMREKSASMQVYFNNHAQGNAPTNAKKFAALMVD
jgi:uncharacterized protein YecE (DUF72 family)